MCRLATQRRFTSWRRWVCCAGIMLRSCHVGVFRTQQWVFDPTRREHSHWKRTPLCSRSPEMVNYLVFSCNAKKRSCELGVHLRDWRQIVVHYKGHHMATVQTERSRALWGAGRKGSALSTVEDVVRYEGSPMRSSVHYGGFTVRRGALRRVSSENVLQMTEGWRMKE